MLAEKLKLDYTPTRSESMSKATKRKLEAAKETFLKFLDTVDIPAGEDKIQASCTSGSVSCVAIHFARRGTPTWRNALSLTV